MDLNLIAALINAFASGMLLVLVGTQQRTRALNAFLLALNLAALIWNVSRIG